jgi:hypothetical protein
MGETSMKKVIVAGMLLAFLAGCSAGDRRGLLEAGYSTQYVDGYMDGYSAGCHMAGHPFYRFTRDISRYEQEGQYMKGWNDGFTIARCDYAALW